MNDSLTEKISLWTCILLPLTVLVAKMSPPPVTFFATLASPLAFAFLVFLIYRSFTTQWRTDMTIPLRVCLLLEAIPLGCLAFIVTLIVCIGGFGPPD